MAKKSSTPSPSTSSKKSSLPSSSSSTPPTPTTSARPSLSNSLLESSDDNGYTPGTTPIRFYDDKVEQKEGTNESTLPSQTQLLPPPPPSARSSPSRSSKSSISLKGLITRAVLLYLAIAYSIACPRDPSYAICPKLDLVASHIKSLEPVVRPYVKIVETKLEPYLVQGRPYIQAVKPYYEKVKPIVVSLGQRVQPYLTKVVALYDQHLHPLLLSGLSASQQATKPYVTLVKQHYASTLAPTVEWYTHSVMEYYTTKFNPGMITFTSTGRQIHSQLNSILSPVYSKYFPFLRHHLFSTLLPSLHSSFSSLRSTYLVKVQPWLINAFHNYKGKVVPSLHRFWSLYVEPQLAKVREQIFEYKSLKEEKVTEVAMEEKVVEVLEALEVDDLESFIAELREEPVAVVEAEVPVDSAASTTTSIPVPDPAELLAITAAKRLALETLSTSYEKEIAKLGQTEHALLSERLIQIRSDAVEDIPLRFHLVIEKVEEEGDRLVGKLSKYFNKSKWSKGTSEERINDAEFLVTKAKAKMAGVRTKAGEEVEAYAKEVEEREVNAVRKAAETIKSLVAKAQEELGFGWTWLDDVTHADWQRFHRFAKVDTTWTNNYIALQTDEELTTIDPTATLVKVVEELDHVVEAFEGVLEKIKLRGQQDLRDEEEKSRGEEVKPSIPIPAIVEAVIESASAVVDTVVSAVIAPVVQVDAAEPIYSILPITEISSPVSPAPATPSPVVPESTTDITAQIPAEPTLAVETPEPASTPIVSPVISTKEETRDSIGSASVASSSPPAPSPVPLPVVSDLTEEVVATSTTAAAMEVQEELEPVEIVFEAERTADPVVEVEGEAEVGEVGKVEGEMKEEEKAEEVRDHTKEDASESLAGAQYFEDVVTVSSSASSSIPVVETVVVVGREERTREEL